MSDDELDDPAAPELPTAPDPGVAAAASWPRGSVTVLANRLGLNRRTIYKLLARGAPGEPVEMEWRRWCKQHGVRKLRPPVDAGLEGMLTPGSSTVPVSAPGAESAAGAAGSPTATTPTEESAQAELARKRTLLVEEQTIVARNERLRQERTLLHRDEVRNVLGAFCLAVVADLADLPAILSKALPEFPVELRRQLRKGGEQASEHLRARFTTDIRRRVEALLASPKD